MNRPRVLFLGGNGHDPVRLEPAREVVRQRGEPFELVDVPCPRTATYTDLLDELARALERAAGDQPRAPLYTTGIGALVALSLRARGELHTHPLVLQGAVLWGLEQRWFPRVMRVPPMPHLLAWAFTRRRVQAHFAAKHFRSAHDPAWLARFFAGYRDADAFASWFRWLTPALLRRLERELPATPGALDQVEAWWGEADTVVGVEELRVTERALGTRLPLRTFPDWGHYPMVDDPAGWVAEVSRVVETAGALR